MSLSEFYDNGPKTWNEAFPPLCLKTHWNPTAVSDHILPKFQHTMTLDPRPSSKICTAYYTLYGNDAPIQSPARETVFPPGGKAGLGFPSSGFQPSAESELLRLDEPLTKCAERRYIPATIPPATNYIAGADRQNLSPYSTVVRTTTGCREEDDARAWNRSSRLFFNPTKYDRTIHVPQNLTKPSSQFHMAC